MLTSRIAYLLEQGVKPWEILAITFTNKAAAEMKQRVENIVGPAAKQIWLSTFHAFCARFLRMEVEATGWYGRPMSASRNFFGEADDEAQTSYLALSPSSASFSNLSIGSASFGNVLFNNII